MADEVVAEGAAATAADTQADTTAGSQNTGNASQPEVPFHQHPRWQQLMGERRQDRQTIAELHRRLETFERAQQQNGQPQPSADETQAAEALKRLLGLHPELKGLLDAPKYGQKLDQLEKLVGQLMSGQHRGLVTSSRQTITETATRLGVDAGRLEKLVLGFLADDPALAQRFAQGDPAIVREVLKDLEDNVFGKLKREAAASLGTSKLATALLPKPGASTMPGEPAAKPLEQGKEREYRRDMHTDARRLLRELTTQG